MSSVLSEHLGYLRLPGRFDLYAEALGNIVKPGDVVADLGCGVGVLGLQALRAGAARVYGIDHSDAIELARETMAREGLSGRYTCIRESSFRAELPERVDVLVCDHVGFFGVDYGIVAMLQDARARLLKPGGAVVPRQLTLYLAAVSSQQCRDIVAPWSEPPVPGEYSWLGEQAANSHHAVELAADDLATDPVAVLTVALDTDQPDTLSMTAELELTRDAELDGLAGWFDCELAPGVTMTNSPLADDAIGRPQAFFPFTTPIAGKSGDILETELRIRHDTTIIAWSAGLRHSDRRQKMTNWKSRVLTRQDIQARLDTPLALNREGRARQAVLALVDGKRTAREIEALVFERHPDLFPSEAETSRFVRAELVRIADS